MSSGSSQSSPYLEIIKNLIFNQKEESTDYLPFSVAYQQSPEFKDLKLVENFSFTVFVFQIFFATIADKLRDEIGLNPNFESEQLYLQLVRPSTSFLPLQLKPRPGAKFA